MNLRAKIIVLSRVAAVTVLALTAVFIFGGGRAFATGNQDLSFEGKIVNATGANAGGNITDGSYNVEFKIYTGCTNEPTNNTGCSAVWTEDWLVGGTLPVQPVVFTSGTFQVNLGSICSLNTTGTCEGNSNTAINWETTPLYLSMQMGNTSTCSTLPPAGSFTADCGGDSVMSPYILLTSSPYAQDSAELGGALASAYSQLAANQTFTGTDTFQPTSNISSVVVKQTSNGAPSADVFDVQGASSGNFIQVTSTAANAGAVLINSLGSNALTLQSGDGNILLGTTTSVASTNGLTITGGSTLALNSTTSSAITLDSGTTGQVNVGTGTSGSKTIQIGATVINTGNTQTIDIGTTNVAGTENVLIGTGASATGGTTTLQSFGTLSLGNSISPTVTVQTSGTGTANIQGGTGGVNVGTTALANTIQIGTILTNTGNTQAINIGTTNLAGTENVTIGSNSGATAGTTTLQSQGILSIGNAISPTINLQTATAGNINVGTNAVNDTVTIGATVINTGNTQTIDIGTTNVAGTENVLIGTGASATGGTTTLQSFGTLSLGNSISPTVTVQTSGTGTANIQGGTGGVNVGTTALANTIQIGTILTNTGNTQAINIGTTNLAGTENVTIGSNSGATAGTTTLQSQGILSIGNAISPTINLQTATAGNINVGTNAVNDTVTIGTTGTATNISNVGIDNTAGSGVGTDSSIVAIGGAGLGISDTITGGATPTHILQTLSNTPNAFEILDSNGQADLNVDTTSNTNFLADPDFAASTGTCPGTTGLTNWVTDGTGSPTDLCQNTTVTDTYEGHTSLELVTSATTAGQGIKTTDFSPSPTVLQVYTVSFYAMMGSGTMPADQFTVTSTDGAAHTCTGAVNGSGTATLNANGFQEVSCSLPATTATMTALTIADNVAGVETMYIDDVQLQAGGTATAFQLGDLQLRGVITNPVAFQNTANSNTAFQVENSAGTNVINVDTLDDVVQIGSQVDNTNPAFLELNNYNSYTDPASTCSGTNNQGALYYNVVSDSIRGCIDGGWHDLISTAGLGLNGFGVVSTSGTNPGDLASLSTLDVSGPCKVSYASATTITIQPCTAYSGGRKIVYAGQTGVTIASLITSPNTALTTTDRWGNLCFATPTGAASNTLQILGPGASITAANMEPTFSASAPILCLATIQNGTSASNTFTTAGRIFDTRTFTDTVKEFSTSAAALALGYSTVESGVTAQVTVNSATGAAKQEGIVVASNGSTSTTAPNIILATNGPVEAMNFFTTASTIGDLVEGIAVATTDGDTEATTATAVTTDYGQLGIAQNVAENNGTNPTTAATATGSIFFNLNISY